MLTKYAQGFFQLIGKQKRNRTAGTILNAIGTEIRVHKNAKKGSIFIEDQGTYTLRNDILVKALLLRPSEG